MFLLAPLPAAGQAADSLDRPKGLLISLEDSFLEPLQKRDSALVADQFRYGFHLVKVAEGTQFALPDFSRGFMDSVEVISPWLVDTVKTYGGRNEAKAYDIDVSLVITSFEEGKHTLLPLSVIRRSGVDRIDTLLFSPRSLDIRAMPVDTATYRIHDIKGQIRYPLTVAELIPYVLGIWALAILGILVWNLLSIRKKGTDSAVRSEPPHLVALRKLDRYRGNRYWAPEKQKIFYSGITDALREYIEARYAIDAQEMTTAEIFRDLQGSDVPEELYKEARTLFETADFVKFAKACASEEENAAALPTAVKFVTTTYQAQLAREESGKGGEA